MSIPFDQYQRYYNAKKIVDLIRDKKNRKLKILEVGANEHQLLEKFLPNDDIMYLDIELPERLLNNPKYILGDATDMSFDDNEYDLIIALDVFEHIPKEKRENFIKELYRVSKISFIVAAPFYSEKVESAEKRLNELFKVVYNIEYRWLQEHIQNGLPDIECTLNSFKELNIPYSVYEHGNLDIWEKMTKINFLSILDSELGKYRGYIDEYYNKFIEPYDYSKNSYRKFLIGYKENLCIDMDEFKESVVPIDNYNKLEGLEREFNILFFDKSLKQEKHEIVEILKNYIADKDKNRVEIGKKDYLKIYVKNDDDYSEGNVIPILIEENRDYVYENIELKKFNTIHGLRIDPSSKCCAIIIKSLVGVNKDSKKINLIKNIKTNSEKTIENNIIIFKSDDPQIIISHSEIQDLVEVSIEIEYIAKNLKTILLLEKLYNEKELLNDLVGKFDEVKGELLNKIKEKQDLEVYLSSTLEHVNKLERICNDLTVKGRIKKAFRKVGIKKDNLLFLLIKNPNLISKGLSEFKQNGMNGVKNKIKKKQLATSSSENYMFTQAASKSSLSTEEIMNKIDMLEIKPKFSIIMPVYNVEIKWLEKAIKSVENQTYPYWELCIVDDCSDKQELIGYLKSLKSEKIKVKFSEKNGGISKASNMAVDMSENEYLILMDNDDEMREEALFEIADVINKFGPDIIYSDEDKISIDGRRYLPFLKPDWSPDLLYSQMYICHLFIMKKKLFERVGGFRSEFDGSQDYDLILRMSEVTQDIYHIPKVLYSWREIPTSTAMNPESKPYAHVAGLKALDEHLKRKYGNIAYAEETENLFVYDARFKLDEEENKVSIIIPTKDKIDLLNNCVESILNKTNYSNYEILIINNNSEEDRTYKWFNEIQEKYNNIRVIDAFYEFNWSKLNNHGIREAKGNVYVFLNNDTSVISGDWLTRLAENALRNDIGTVGGLLLYEDGTIQHAGVVLGMGGWADHVFKGMEPIHFGSPYVSPIINRNVVACTGACLAISKKTIEKIGEFDEKFIICGSDVEISIRARKHKLNNLYDARVKLYHLESKSRDSYIPPIDFEMSKLHYKYYLDNGDPYYNSQLDLNSTSPKLKE